MTKHRWLLAVMSICSAVTAAAQSTRTLYGDPILLSDYVDDPRAAIVEGIRQFQWVVREEQPGKLVVQLDRSSVAVLNAIYFDKRQIRFEDVSALSYSCANTAKTRKQKRSERNSSSEDEDEGDDQPDPLVGLPQSPSRKTCPADESDLKRWRLNLRRGVLEQLRELALADAFEKYARSAASAGARGLESPATVTIANGSAIEQAMYAVLLNESPALAQMAARATTAFYPHSEQLTDVAADKLLAGQKQPKLSDSELTAAAWAAKVLGETHNARYRGVLLEARQNYTNTNVLRSIDCALEAISDSGSGVTRYAAGTVQLKDQRAALQQLLANTSYDRKSLAGIQPGTSLASALAKLGPPDAYSDMAFRDVKEGEDRQLALHYADVGFVTLKYLAGDERHWIVTNAIKELVPVRANYKGDNFGMAQALVGWRGIALRDYAKLQYDEIESDPALIDVLEKRLLTVATPLDRFEDRGLTYSLEALCDDRAVEYGDRLRNIAAVNKGRDVQKTIAGLLAKANRSAKKKPQ